MTLDSTYMKLRNIFLISSFLFFISSIQLHGQDKTTHRVYDKDYVTYPYSDPNPIPNFSNLYPYYRHDGFTNKSTNQSWQIIELENDYIKLLIFPEIGGKIWTAIEKKTNKPFLYNNNVVKFRDIAIRGPWTSGGLESNFGVLGHSPNCSTPIDFKIIDKADGSVSCYIGTLDLMTRAYWRNEINLPKDKAYFTTNIVWYNATDMDQPYYHWMNAGLKTGNDMEFIYPGNKYIEHDGIIKDWPVNKENGKNISFYRENNFGPDKSYHIFGKHTDFSGAYWHNDSLGMVRYARRSDKVGTKLWIWALSDNGKIWEELLTDKDGQYMELQSGRLFNQNVPKSSYTPFKSISFAPYNIDVWSEYWYPVLKSDGLVKADKSGGLNIFKRDSATFIKYSSASYLNDSIQIYLDDAFYKSSRVQLKPLELYSDTVKKKFEKIVVKFKENEFYYDSKEDADTLRRPRQTLDHFNWKSALGYALLAQDAMDRNDYRLAEENFLHSLALDENNIQALLGLSKLLYRNARYKEALENVAKVLSLNAYDSDANYYYGLINDKLGYLIDAKDGFEVASITSKNRNAAFIKLSSILFKENKINQAIEYAERSSALNPLSINSLANLSLFYRIQGNKMKAEEVLKQIESIDPLNHFVYAERYISNPNSSTLNELKNVIQNELAYESYLELAMYYYNLNRKNDALSVLNVSPKSSEAEIWKSYLKNEIVNFDNIDVDFVFPFRAETLHLLEDIKLSASHWKLDYLVSLIYLYMNRIDEAKVLLNKWEDQPNLPTYYAVRASLNTDNTEAEMKRAIQLKKDWRFYKILAEHYNNVGEYGKSVALLRDSKIYQANGMMELLYVTSLILNGNYSQAESLLKNIEILPYEGATQGRVLYRNVKLFQSLNYLAAHRNKQADNFLKQSMLWPKNLGVGKPYDEEIDKRLEDWLSYLISGKKDKKKLEDVLSFKPKIEGNISNYYPENTLITLLAYEEKNENEQAKAWLDNLQQELLYDTEIKQINEYYQRHKTIKDYFKDESQQRNLNNKLIKKVFEF